MTAGPRGYLIRNCCDACAGWKVQTPAGWVVIRAETWSAALGEFIKRRKLGIL